MAVLDPTDRDPWDVADWLLHQIDLDDLSPSEKVAMAAALVTLAKVAQNRLTNLISALREHDWSEEERALLRNVIRARLDVFPPNSLDGSAPGGGE